MDITIAIALKAELSSCHYLILGRQLSRLMNCTINVSFLKHSCDRTRQCNENLKRFLKIEITELVRLEASKPRNMSYDSERGF